MKRDKSIVTYALCSYVGISLNAQYTFATVFCFNEVTYGITYVIITVNAKS